MSNQMSNQPTDASNALAHVESNDLMKMMQLTASNINGLSQQMGLVNARLDDHSKRMDRIEEEHLGLKSELTVNRSQARRIKSAIHNRVAGLLKLEFDGGKVASRYVGVDLKYRGGFLSRCYNDARTKSKLGTPYYDTLRSDFHEVLEYIESWEPEVSGGTDGYKRYLDIRHKESA